MHKFLSALALTLLAQLTVAATPSASGTTIPPATQIVDSELDVWTVLTARLRKWSCDAFERGDAFLYAKESSIRRTFTMIGGNGAMEPGWRLPLRLPRRAPSTYSVGIKSGRRGCDEPADIQ